MSESVKIAKRMRGVRLGGGGEQRVTLVENCDGETKVESQESETDLRFSLLVEEELSRRLEVLQEEWQREKEVAYRAGFEEGRRVGVEVGREEVGPALESLNQALKELSAYREELLKGLEPVVVELGQAIAERVVEEEIKANPQIILNTVRRALEWVVGQTHLVIRINPADLAIIRENHHTFSLLTAGFKNFEIREDPQVARGGCVVETDSGTVDARIEAQLDEVHRALREGLRSGEFEGKLG